MAKFIPRSVSRGDNSHNRGGFNPNFRGRGRDNRGGFVNRGRGRGRGRGDGFWGRGGRRPYNNFRGRGKFVPDNKKAPLKILFPDDPRHPDFKNDPRNADKIKRLEDRHDRKKSKHAEDKSDDEASDHGSEHEPDMQREESGNFSDEGLRITVENKGSSLPVAGSSFYDEIQQSKGDRTLEKDVHQKSTKGKDNLPKETRSKSPQSKKQSKKGDKESIQITVGNDRFQTKDTKDKKPVQNVDNFSRKRSPSPSRKRSPLREESRQQNRDQHRGTSRSPSRDKHRSRSRERYRTNTKDKYNDRRKQGRYRSASRSPDRFQSKNKGRKRSLSKERYPPRHQDRYRSRSGSRPRYRSKSRSPNRFRSRSGSRGRARSRSGSRGRFRSRSGSRGRFRSRSGSRGRFRSRSGSRGRVRSRSGSRGRFRSRSGSRGRFRSRSGSRGRFRSRSGSRGRFRSRSSSRGRFRSRSISRERIGKKLEDKMQRTDTWSRESLSSISDGSFHGDDSVRGGSNNEWNSPEKPKDPHSRNRKQGNQVTTTELTAKMKVAPKPKENPFMEFLNELDYKKLAEDPEAEVSRSSRSLPWLQNSAKGANVAEIEQFLERKLMEAGREKLDAKFSTPATSAQYGKDLESSRKSRNVPVQHAARGPSGDMFLPSSGSHRAKESTPFDIYDNLVGDDTEKMARPPPSQAKPIKSILKNKTAEPSPKVEPFGRVEDQPFDSQTVYSDASSLSGFDSQAVGLKKPTCPQPSVPLPGMASMMNIEDEDEFLYGGDDDMPTSNTFEPPADVARKVPPPVDDSVYLGGYHGNKSDPGWEVAPSKPGPVAVEDNTVTDIPQQSPTTKPEPDKLSGDPTIQNILKSIGFNFELSKLMQEKAEQGRKKQEETEAYGIKQGSSFLAGGIKGSDLATAFNEQEEVNLAGEKKGKEPRKTSIDRKESYEERARRYREEQQQIYKSEKANSEPPHHDNRSQYPGQDTSQIQGGYAEQQGIAPETSYQETASHHYPQDYAYGGQYSYHQSDQVEAVPIRHSNLTLIQTVDSNEDCAGGSLDNTSALQQLQSTYHDDDRLHDRDDRRRYHGRKPEDEYREYNRRQSPGPEDKRRQHDSRYGIHVSNELGDYDARRHKANAPERRQSSYERSDSYDKSNSKQQQQPGNIFPIIRDRNRHRSESPLAERSSSSSSTSRRTVLPPKSEMLRVQEEEQRPKEEERRKIQVKPKVTKSPMIESQPEPKAVKKVSSMSSTEREELMREIEERAKRLSALEKELLRLRKQENELMRKKQRQKDGHKDHLLEQNTELQKEISKQISVLRKAAEVNAKLLSASRKDNEDEIDFMALVKNKKPDHKKKRKKSRSPSLSPSPSRPEESEKETKTKSKEIVKEEKPLEEKIKSKKKQINYEYFDSGNHWCKQCNHVSSNVYEFFGHLQSKKHSQKLDPYDRPWMPESLKNPSNIVKGQTVAAAFKGVEFMMSTQAFYCSLCKAFSGDMTCAEEHLKSSDHNEKYQEYVKENPFYERRYNLDKAAGLSVTSVVREKDDDSDDERHSRDKAPKGKDRERKKDSDYGKKKAVVEAALKEIQASKRRRELDAFEDEERDRRAKRKTAYDEQERKKAKLSEAKKKEALQKNKELIEKEKQKDPSVAELDDEPEAKRTIITMPKASEPRPAPFGRFSWKGPMIGKAPGYKKPASAEASSDSGKISIKLSGKAQIGKVQQKEPPPKEVVNIPAPVKEPAFVLRKKPVKQQVFGPAPLDIFLKVGGDPTVKGQAIPTIGTDPPKKVAETSVPLSENLIAEAFSGKKEESNKSEPEMVSSTAQAPPDQVDAKPKPSDQDDAEPKLFDD